MLFGTTMITLEIRISDKNMQLKTKSPGSHCFNFPELSFPSTLPKNTPYTQKALDKEYNQHVVLQDMELHNLVFLFRNTGSQQLISARHNMC